MKILFAASEVAPFIKTGGLADVAGSLPGALASLGHEVTVILPLYEKIAPKWRERMTFVKHFTVPLSWRNAYCGIFRLEKDGVTYWFVDNEYYFKRADLYGHFDDAERFAFFSRAVVTAPVQMDWIPNVIHCNDWQTALVPLYLAGGDSPMSGTKTVFTIHNIEYQGRYSRGILEDVFGLNADFFHEKLLAYYGDINLMKGAIYAADYVTTVSPTYAKELHDPFYAHGLEGVIAENAWKMQGILNGIDTALYDPRTDAAITAHFSPDDLAGKKECKAALQRIAGLNEDPNVPIVACVSRLVPHKGFDMVAEVLWDIMGLDLQMVVLGTGEARYEDTFRHAQQAFPGRFSAHICYSAELSSAIYAGADLFLMPSVAEPCGLSQIIAMRYGTLPLVRETGGLKDTVTACTGEEGVGTGFAFASANAHDMHWVLSEAVDLYRQSPLLWADLMKNAMTADFGWSRSALEYEKIYYQLTGGYI